MPTPKDWGLEPSQSLEVSHSPSWNEKHWEVSFWAVRAQHFPAHLYTWLCTRLRLLETRKTTIEVLPYNKLAPCLNYIYFFFYSPGQKVNRRFIEKSCFHCFAASGFRILEVSCLVTLADVSLNLAPARWLETTLLWNNYTTHALKVISRNCIKYNKSPQVLTAELRSASLLFTQDTDSLTPDIFKP